jgi:aurora kinase
VQLGSEAQESRLSEHLERASSRLSDSCEQAALPSTVTTELQAQDEPHISSPSLLKPSDFEIGSKLGRGKFGRVYLARHLTTNYICALKVISKVQCVDEEEERLIRRELEAHGNLAHKNILKLLSWFHDDKSIYLVLEFAPGGSLFSRLEKQPKGRFDERAAARYIAQIAEALRYIHGKRVIHRGMRNVQISLHLH